ncbi:MAG: lamin tail domain-containing protein [Nanoarchaeota archaeon]
MKSLNFLLILLLVPSVNALVLFNEIMYNPFGSDTGREWIELYNNGECVNLTNWKLYEAGVNHGLTLINGSFIICEDEYLIIADDANAFLEEYTNFNGILIDSTFSLSNNNESITLKNSTSIVDNITYFSSLGGNGNGNTICRMYSTWQECSPSPGKNNLILESKQEYTILINEFLPDPYGYDNANMPDGEWIELFNYGNLSLDLSGLKISDNANHTILITDTRTTNGTIIHPNSFLVAYANGFSGLLNNDGFEEIRLIDQSNNVLDKVSYDSSKEGVAWAKVNSIWQQTIPTPNAENIDNSVVWESRLSIEKLYLGSDNKAKFGDTLRVKINIYRGNATKETAYLYIEGLSKRDTITLDKKYTNYTMTIPIQIEPNCNNNLPDGEYNMILEGLDKINKTKLKINGINEELCEKIINPKTVNYEILEAPNEAEVNKVIKTKIEIINIENKNIDFEVWSYIGKNSKDNLQKITLPAKSSAVIELKNIITDLEPGNYSYIIKINKEDRKTTKTINSSIKVLNTLNTESESIINAGSSVKEELVYSSKSERIKKIAIYFINLVLVLIIIALVKNEHNH